MRFFAIFLLISFLLFFSGCLSVYKEIPESLGTSDLEKQVLDDIVSINNNITSIASSI